jgi:hypothetical protein
MRTPEARRLSGDDAAPGPAPSLLHARTAPPLDHLTDHLTDHPHPEEDWPC